MELKKLLETKNLAVTSENYHNFAVSLLKSQKNVSGSEAKLFLQDMKAKGVKGNEIVYSAIISRFIAAGGEYISDAISLLKELKSEGVVIPSSVHQAVVAALSKTQNFKEAETAASLLIENDPSTVNYKFIN